MMRRILLGLIMMLALSPGAAQTYGDSYAGNSYEQAPYRPARHYARQSYLPETVTPACLTCNDCQVPNLITPLPVQTLLFRATRQDQGEVQLSWNWLSPVPPAGIRLRWRPAEADTFQQLVTLPGDWEQFRHRLAPEGRLYYQLVLVDADGRQMASPIREVAAIHLQPRLQVWPNPGFRRVQLQLSGVAPEAGRLLVHDVQGRLVLAQAGSPAGAELVVELPAELSPGLYWLTWEQAGTRLTSTWMRRESP